jgi:hypothetical protein
MDWSDERFGLERTTSNKLSVAIEDKASEAAVTDLVIESRKNRVEYVTRIGVAS